MNKTELLKRLSEKISLHCQDIGLPPFKCQQMITDKMLLWEKMSEGELEKALNTDEPQY